MVNQIRESGNREKGGDEERERQRRVHRREREETNEEAECERVK